VPYIKQDIKSASLLTDPKTGVGVTTVMNGLLKLVSLKLPEKAPDAIASVICLDVSAPK